MSTPKVVTGKPSILFDSRPEQQETYIGSYYSALKGQLYTALTGNVTPFHPPGQLRLIWWTVDGKRGMKDYDLHKHAMVRENFYELDGMKDVKRVVIMGYAGQNPFMLGEEEMYGKSGNGWKEESEAEVRARKKVAREKMDNAQEGRTGKLIDIEDVIEQSDKAEQQKLREAREKKWKDSDGLMSGEMV
ncbi:hypothetical protein BJ875DRAFT_467456 [Amylocarpus encephaloides]|uniref:Uncharacterized protein n=1 Tax=Amylocarpus encephaloides TaxID=45428 RepID=A0A9P7YFS2_9HELO|nr:hypothetical protein BJ875DRAFT_467456 [Amylocarpus encephaloides]